MWSAGLAAILLLGLLLRLKGIHNPLLDHPGWRQGDTASIAKNFATLQFNVLYPQTNYDGPPPNYVELELQIVPMLAAIVYKVFGVHEIAGRLIGVAFSLGTIATIGYFARWLFASEIAGLGAALLFAIEPGSFYYARTFTPDTTMVFFMTAALYAGSRLIVDDEHWTARSVIRATALLALALLAKPVSIVALVPLAALLLERGLASRTMRWSAIAAFLLIPLAVLYAYDRAVAAHAEWHWAAGITQLHVLPALALSFRSFSALHAKLVLFRQVLAMLASTMTGPAISAIALLGLAFMPGATRTRTLLWAWLIGGLIYVYVVVTVERVDYYMYLLLPLAALTGAAFLDRFTRAVLDSRLSQTAKYACAAAAALAIGAIVWQNRAAVAPYYRYSKAVYRNAISLDHVLAPGTLIVMGHYDPSVLYYIARYGWEEDPYLWTPFDEQSAIHKGARYFIDIEKNRFNRNVELCAWMQRFPVLNPNAQWVVYVTDPAQVKPAAEQQWRAFRNAEKAGKAREWLDTHHSCGAASAPGNGSN